MPLYAAQSRVVTDPAGTVWLEPDPAGLRHRRAVAGGLGAIGAGAIATALVAAPLPVAVAAVVAGAGGGAALLIASTRAGARVGVSLLGISLVGGVGTAHVGWAGLTEIRTVRAGRRRRVVLQAGDAVHACPTRFQPQAARRWLDRCAAAAERAGVAVDRAGGDRLRLTGPDG